MRLHAFALVGFFSLSTIATAAPQTTKDNSQLELGVLSFKAGQYEDAIQHFQKAALAEPENSTRTSGWRMRWRKLHSGCGVT